MITFTIGFIAVIGFLYIGYLVISILWAVLEEILGIFFD